MHVWEGSRQSNKLSALIRIRALERSNLISSSESSLVS